MSLNTHRKILNEKEVEISLEIKGLYINHTKKVSIKLSETVTFFLAYEMLINRLFIITIKNRQILL